MNLAESHGLKMTFFAEVGQQLAFLEQAGTDSELTRQARLWEEAIGLMLARGFDVQMHVHPHWFRAKRDVNGFALDRNWNLATYPPDERRAILAKSTTYLRQLVAKHAPGVEVEVFKAGSYGTQPSAGLLRDLREAGFRLVLGVQKGLRIDHPDFQADCMNLEEDTLPYCPVIDDICRVGDGDADLTVVPMTHYVVDIRSKAARVVRRLVQAARPAKEPAGAASGATRAPSPLVPSFRQRVTQQLLGRSYARLDLGSGQRFTEWKWALDRIMARLADAFEAPVPFTIECHSKNIPGNEEQVRRFWDYLFTAYDERIETETMSGLLNRIDAGAITIRKRPAR